MRTFCAALAWILIAAGCAGPDDDCARRLADDEPIPAAGCCTDDGLCVRPPVYDAEWCGQFSAADCLPFVYPAAYEGGPEWVFCPPRADATLPHEPCPVEWLSHANTAR